MNENIKRRIKALVGVLRPGPRKKWTPEKILDLTSFLEEQGPRDDPRNFNLALEEAAKKFECSVSALRAVIYQLNKTGEVNKS
ncbi:MAG: hypothetical protein ACREC4_02760 [Methylocella sp.]